MPEPLPVHCAHDRMASVSSLRPNPRNPNRHPPEQIALLAKIIGHQGWRALIVVSQRSGLVVAGHGRLSAALELGVSEVPVNDQQFASDEDEHAHLLADNRIAELSDTDGAMLKDILVELDTGAFEMDLTGFSNREIERVINSFSDGDEKDAPAQFDKAEELRAKWGVETGQLWTLGNHRLICGDCTNAAVVGRLLGGEKCSATVTDPPYAIGLEYDSHEDSVEELRRLADGFLPLAREHSEVVLLTPGVTRQWMYPEPQWVLCWFYGGGQLRSSWGFNCWQPILCYGKDPFLARGFGAMPDAFDMNMPANAGDIDHPCPKPLAVWSWVIQRATPESGMSVFDPFLGSGTTIIACENLRRRCFGIEISPSYVAVALQRWADLTGKNPTLIQ